MAGTKGPKPEGAEAIEPPEGEGGGATNPQRTIPDAYVKAIVDAVMGAEEKNIRGTALGLLATMAVVYLVLLARLGAVAGTNTQHSKSSFSPQPEELPSRQSQLPQLHAMTQPHIKHIEVHQPGGAPSSFTLMMLRCSVLPTMTQPHLKYIQVHRQGGGERG